MSSESRRGTSGPTDSSEHPASCATPAFPPIVSAEWLVAHRDEVVVADVRWYLDGRSGRAAYDGGHLPGAVWVDLDRVLAAPPSVARGRHPLPDPATFTRGLSELGISDDATVIAYDDAGGMAAARLVWLLRILGQRAALLDGGIGAWPAPLEIGAVQLDPVARAVREWPPERLVDADAVAAAAATRGGDNAVAATTATAAQSGGAIVLDARAPERYRGEVEPIDPRAGHVPGARNVPFAANLDADGRFRAPDELRATFAAAGVDLDGDAANESVTDDAATGDAAAHARRTPATPPIVYCGSGVTACHLLIALEAAGLGVGRLYPGSWSQWSGDPSRPAATGSEP